MPSTSRQLRYGLACVMLTIVVGVLYVITAMQPVSASSCHGNSSTAAPAPSKTPEPAFTKNSAVLVIGRVVGADRTKQTVTLQLELPVNGEAVKALSQLKQGAAVSVTINVDKNGKAIATALSAGTATTTLKLTGIQCQACADRLSESLKGVSGVSQVTVTSEPARAVVSYDPALATLDALKDTVRNTEPIHAGMPFGVED